MPSPLLLLQNQGRGKPIWTYDPRAEHTIPRFLDTFTDTNGVLLENHTPDIDIVGGGWVDDADEWEIQSNKATTSLGQAHTTEIDVGTADYTLKVTHVTDSAATGGWIVFRGSWGVQFDLGDVSVVTPGGFIVLFAEALSTSYDIIIVCRGNRINIWIDGVLVFSGVDDTGNDVTTILLDDWSFFHGGNFDSTWDNLTVMV